VRTCVCVCTWSVVAAAAAPCARGLNREPDRGDDPARHPHRCGGPATSVQWLANMFTPKHCTAMESVRARNLPGGNGVVDRPAYAGTTILLLLKFWRFRFSDLRQYWNPIFPNSLSSFVGRGKIWAFSLVLKNISNPMVLGY